MLRINIIAFADLKKLRAVVGDAFMQMVAANPARLPDPGTVEDLTQAVVGDLVQPEPRPELAAAACGKVGENGSCRLASDRS